MQVTIEIAPETSNVMRERAAQHGLPLEAYLQSLIEELGHRPGSGVDGFPFRSRQSLEEFERDWNAFCEPIAGLPPISDEDLSRAAIYSDHD